MHLLITAIVAALLMTISLKGLHFFSLIPWQPVSFLKKYEWFEWTAFERWAVLFLILAVCAYVITLLAQFLFKAPPFLFSLILGLVIAVILEWLILDLPIEFSSVKKLSIPFIIVVLTIMRFIIETAQYKKLYIYR
ncbi:MULTISPECIES: DNA helicase [Solibacillus]|uniref:DNA helicase n=1 Tax=Solibacillus merdavium TaxID=2762218 RepID=A0ABR8XNF1_9BACL|nr:DNA helicase [Solibacillus merdavium]MBD8033468.1 DNA helicase [Solibacillus merdavium]